MKKKSQIEIMGMAIVIILVALGILFVLRFVILKQPSELKKSFSQSQIASNTLNTLLKTTTVGCKNTDITELLSDCALYQGGGIFCDDGSTSCQFANKTIKKILNDTLAKWGNNYEFLAYTGPDVIITNIVNNGCPEEKESKVFPISLYSVTLTVQLYICD